MLQERRLSGCYGEHVMRRAAQLMTSLDLRVHQRRTHHVCTTRVLGSVACGGPEQRSQGEELHVNILTARIHDYHLEKQ